jgi:hypothetical protein
MVRPQKGPVGSPVLVRGSAQNWQEFRFRATYGRPIAVITGLGVLGDLFGRFKVHLIDGIFVELAVVRRVVATDLGAGVINPASMVRLEMLAGRMDEEVPHVVFYENTSPIVKKVPTHEVEILFARRFFDGECKVAAAFRGAVVAEGVAAGDFFSLRDSAVDGFGGS